MHHFHIFKHELGQVNHYLITILIGLEGIRSGIVDKEANFNVSWNPKSKIDSADRSSYFVRKATLTWAITVMDAYLSELSRSPISLEDTDFHCACSARSVYNKLNALQIYIGYKIDEYISLVHLGIQWRNNLVHDSVNNKFDDQFRDYLDQNRSNVNTNFCGLDVSALLDHFETNNSPSLKEVTSIIRSINSCVSIIDKTLVEKTIVDKYAISLVRNDSLFYDGFVKCDSDTRLKKLLQFLLNKGFVPVDEVYFSDKDLELNSIYQELIKTIPHK